MFRTLALLAAALAGALGQTAAAQPDERLFYEITVTAPGTRSQGWRGDLYGPGGAPIAGVPGESVATNAGKFIYVACTELWIPCGFVESEMQRFMQANGGNFILGREPWRYRVYVSAECSRSEGWRGEHVRGVQAVEQGTGALDTPMGPFAWRASDQPWSQHGWFHQAWPKPAMSGDHWPCTS